jgi:hypothetical protein
MAKRVVSVRLDPEDADDFKANTKSNGTTPKDCLRDLVKEYNRTRGLVLRRIKLDKTKAWAAREEDEINRLSLDLQITFSKQLMKDVDAAIQPVFRPGKFNRNEIVPREADYIAFAVTRLAKKHQVSTDSVQMCMRQRVPDLYKDDLAEQTRIMGILQEMEAS